MARIGLLGGSFNPAHGSHRRISLAALRQLRLDAVWWLVSPQNPLKPAAGMAPLAARLARAQAVARHPRIRVSALEAELGTRYAIDTVRALQRRFPQHRFIWLGGDDILAELPRWRDWRGLLALVPIAIAPRPGTRLAQAQALRWAGGFAASPPSGWTQAPLPAIIRLQSRLKPESASALRLADPDWAKHQGTAVDQD